MTSDIEREAKQALEQVLNSASRKKLVVAGPGSGKTFLFGELLKHCGGGQEERLVLTFINNLKADLDRSLGEMATVSTLHGYCQGLLHRNKSLRNGLSADFRCFPGLVSIIKNDWRWINGSEAPEFVKLMRILECSDEQDSFYATRSNFYDAVDFDDSVYRVHQQFKLHPDLLPTYELVLIDEFQDFNKMEAGIIGQLGVKNSIVIAGDDDQALYSTLRGASWEYIRAHYHGGEYTVFPLPFCMRCPEVIVGAVNDVITRSQRETRLAGRIDKPYRYYAPIKGDDSARFPKIDLIQTSVQRLNANYFGRYIEQSIRAMSKADAKTAKEKHEPLALIIGNKPYMPQIEKHLVESGLYVARKKQELNERDFALELLREEPHSNLAWRIILSLSRESIAAPIVRKSHEEGSSIFDNLAKEITDPVLAEAAAWTKPQIQEEDEGPPTVQLTTYEGSKGMSAQYVFLVGLHNGDLPRNSEAISDIEICRFLVGLTRTKKQCTLLLSKRFGNDIKEPSIFLDWIREERFKRKRVNAAYWG